MTCSRVGGAEVVEQPVPAPGQRGESVHRRLDNGRNGRVERVGGLAPLEVDVGVLCHAPHDGTIGGGRRRMTPDTLWFNILDHAR